MKKVFSFLLILFHFGNSTAQTNKIDTVSITLEMAERQFINNNLQLLAQKYNVDATKALIIQARLYPNPDISWGNNFYNSDTKRLFPLSFKEHESDNSFSFNQTIILAKKVKKQVKIAETNYKLAEDNLYDLLRTLKFGLRTTFFNIYYQQQTAKVYDEEIKALETIVSAYKGIQEKGYVSEAEITQIQAQLYALQSEYETLQDNIQDLQSQLRLLVQSTPYIYFIPLVSQEILKSNPLAYSLKSYLDSAYTNRTDIMIAKDNLVLSQQNYSYQKSLAIPDITIGTYMDQSSQYVTDDFSYSLGFAIPIFNRNQGNIKNAHLLIDYSTVELQLTQKTLEDQIFTALKKAHCTDELYRGIDPAFVGNFDRLAKEMLENYKKRNVNLLTFLTFYDSYKQNVVQYNTILFNKVNAMENLNFLTGTDFFNK